MLENGEGAPKSVEEAVEWYEKAAHKGFEPAMTRLGAHSVSVFIYESKSLSSLISGFIFSCFYTSAFI